MQHPLVFTNCGAHGPEGPSQADADAEYWGTNLDGSVIVENGIQMWTVPMDGIYRITALGAQGGGSNGGLGAKVSGDFFLEGGTILEILVGQEGGSLSNDRNTGGGSFVVKEGALDESDILLIAGGGGGARNPVYDERHGTSDGSGNPGRGGYPSNGGTDGNGGSGGGRGGGGGGFFTDGADGTFAAPNGEGGKAYLNGAQGGFGLLTVDSEVAVVQTEITAVGLIPGVVAATPEVEVVLRTV